MACQSHRLNLLLPWLTSGSYVWGDNVHKAKTQAEWYDLISRIRQWPADKEIALITCSNWRLR